MFQKKRVFCSKEYQRFMVTWFTILGKFTYEKYIRRDIAYFYIKNKL